MALRSRLLAPGMMTHLTALRRSACNEAEKKEPVHYLTCSLFTATRSIFLGFTWKLCAEPDVSLTKKNGSLDKYFFFYQCSLAGSVYCGLKPGLESLSSNNK